MPKVSVIIPVYNAEEYLQECLNSIVNQTLSDIEIICVDDGSTDNSLSILSKYAEKDNRIKILTQKNQYAGVARNNGISVATGEYYIFLDADDFFELDLLELQYKQCKLHDADVSLCGADKYDVQTSQYIPTPWLLKTHMIKASLPFNNKTIGNNIYRLTTPAPWNKMFSAEFVAKHKLQFQNTQRANDVYFVHTALNLAERITYVDKVLVHYRVGMTTNLQANNKKTPLDFCHAISKVKDRLIKEDIYQRVQQGFVNDAMGQCEYNLRTLNNKENPAFVELANKIKKQYLHEFDIANKDESYFYENSRYKSFLTQLYSTEPVKISVIIPVYNVEKYLTQCLENIINQSLKEIEIICVNDGSTDGSPNILEEYRKKDYRIKVITQKNGGLSAARNSGVSVATGEYVYFIDSDDYIDIDALEYLYYEAKNNELDILYFDGESFYESEKLKKQFGQNDCCYRKKEYSEVYSGEELYALMRKDNVFRPMVWMQIIRLEYYRNIGISFYEGILHEDVLFSTQCTLKAARVSHRNKAFYHYRRRTGAITSNNISAKKVYSRIIVMEEIIRFMSQNQFAPETYYYMRKYLSWFVGEIKNEISLLNAKNQKELNDLLDCESFIARTIYDMVKNGMGQDVSSNKNIQADKNIIVSLTSFPARIEGVSIVIENMLNQTIKPDQILLYLAEEQFPNKVLPDKLKLLEEENACFNIKYCDDLKPHKKYFYAMQEYPKDIIITVDDDIYYPLDVIEKLLDSYKRYPNAVSCMRGHTIKMYDEETYAPYKKWKEPKRIVGRPSILTLPTGVGGVLYPPGCLATEVFNKDAIKSTCLFADDLWLKWMQLKKGIPCILVQDKFELRYIDGTQDSCLWKDNDDGGRNNSAWRDIIDYCGNLNLEGKSISEQLYKEYVKTYCEVKNDNTQPKVSVNNQVVANPIVEKPQTNNRIARKIRGGIRCYHEHGFKYTFKRSLEHLGIPMGIKLQKKYKKPGNLQKTIKYFREYGMKETLYKIREKLFM